ncbi:MAG TPA: 3D-(3,5/4)-trihydroxycyclohexane-1,2-dione acylhydrolase (decyclizing) [Streptosporangiales bacterium]
MASRTVRLTTSQALVRFLAAQRVTRDGAEPTPFFAGAFGIFGHGNLAGIGQALLEYQDEFRYIPVRNEQAMVHMASGYAKMRNRMGTYACTSSIGPGATNMVTGAALATINRLPVLLLPGDIFATRRAGAVLQQLESPSSEDISVNDAFKPVSRYWDRVNRPEQLPAALLAAMRVLTSPADTGAATIALPQDVQAEAADFPAELFRQRVWEIPRLRADTHVLDHARRVIAGARRPLLIAGGGVIYAEATEELRAFVEATGIPVGETQAGKGSLPCDHPLSLGAIGVSGTEWANRFAAEADVVLGVGTRYTDFTTGSNTLFKRDDVRFVNLNVAELDALKESAVAVTGDARESLRALASALDGYATDARYRTEIERAGEGWRRDVAAAVAPGDNSRPTQAEVIGAVNAAAGPRDVVVNAAGSMPGELHRLWQSRDPKSYQMEYGYSCMGFEIAGALGAKLADPSREVFALIGDGSWLMLSADIVTTLQEDHKIVVVLVNNRGYGSIGALSQASGTQGFGTKVRFREADGRLGERDVPMDLTANARSLGVEAIDATTTGELRAALEKAKANPHTTVVHVEVDPQGRFSGSGAWWDVPIAETSGLDSTRRAREDYVRGAAEQRPRL